MDSVIVAKELKRIASAKGGILKAADVVQAARPHNSVLHGWFEWDDTKAAEQHRLAQARALIRVAVTLIEGGPPEPTRAFVSLMPDRSSEGGGYRSTVHVLNEPEMARQLLADALAELQTFQRKYQNVAALFPVMKAIGQLMRRQVQAKRPAA